MMPMPQPPATPEPDPDDRAIALLLQAVDTLPGDERTLVLTFLLKRGLATPGPTDAMLNFLSVGSSVRGLETVTQLPPSPSPPQPPGKSFAAQLAAQGVIGTPTRGGTVFSRPTREGQQTVPVRFTTEAHQRLRGWCEANGFPMAAVVRGLVDQFLDGQATA